MENITQEVISALSFLLPGFISAWVFYGLTAYTKPSQFERVIQALIFTIIIQPMVFMSEALFLWAGEYLSFGIWDERTTLVCSIAAAFILGVFLSYLSNNDLFHKILRKFNITRETSYASEWYSAFADNAIYIVLHLSGNRRLYGWLMEWPTEPHNGHFILKEACWLVESEVIELGGVELIMVNGSDVEHVEFMKPIEGEGND